MKPQSSPYKPGFKSGKPSFRKVDSLEKRFPALKKNDGRWRIVQSVQAGRVRGGHGFH